MTKRWRGRKGHPEAALKAEIESTAAEIEAELRALEATLLRVPEPYASYLRRREFAVRAALKHIRRRL